MRIHPVLVAALLAVAAYAAFWLGRRRGSASAARAWETVAESAPPAQPYARPSGGGAWMPPYSSAPPGAGRSSAITTSTWPAMA